MAEFEEKLSAILGDQNAMNQIMALAQSLSGTETGEQIEGEATISCDRETHSRERDVQLLSALRPYLKETRRKKLDRTLELLQLLRLLKGSGE